MKTYRLRYLTFFLATVLVTCLTFNSATAAIVASDLDIFIEKDGMEIQLFLGSEDNQPGNLSLYFDQTSTNSFTGSAPFPTHMRPYSYLSNFIGLPLEGTWTLKILDDHDPGDGDVLYSWSLFGFYGPNQFFHYYGGPEFNVDTNPATLSSIVVDDRYGPVLSLMVGVNIGPTQVPVPSALVLFGTGMLGLLTFKRKRR